VDVPTPDGEVPADVIGAVIAGAAMWSTERTGARSGLEVVPERRAEELGVVGEDVRGSGELEDNDADGLVDADLVGGHGGFASP
jgi:hypothetical protein